MRLGVTGLVFLLLVGAPGCGGSESEGSPAVSSPGDSATSSDPNALPYPADPQSGEPPPQTVEGWSPYAPLPSNEPAAAPATPLAQRVISDWYADGDFDVRHSCEAVDGALAAFPVSLPRRDDVVAAFRRYRATVC